MCFIFAFFIFFTLQNTAAGERPDMPSSVFLLLSSQTSQKNDFIEQITTTPGGRKFLKNKFTTEQAKRKKAHSQSLLLKFFNGEECK